ncbi:MAG TPA: hypothetical protein VKA34_03615 [Balneolales bacterium]|nr:hypothetical protein [Balneolales bacterium]
MKKIYLVIWILMTALPVYAQQEETLFSGGIDHGGFGGPVVSLSSVGGETALFAGGRGGWILKLSQERSFIIGGGGYGLVTDIKADNFVRNGQQLYLSIGYGGIEFEYVYKSNKLIHFSGQALIGGGGVSYRFKDQEDTFDTDSFFVFEPGVNVILNITHFFRMGGGIGYRFISGSELPGATDSDLSSWAAVLTFKFGKF